MTSVPQRNTDGSTTMEIQDLVELWVGQEVILVLIVELEGVLQHFSEITVIVSVENRRHCLIYKLVETNKREKEVLFVRECGGLHVVRGELGTGVGGVRRRIFVHIINEF
ncbi:hypothetical protein U1Q18_007230 [Sarracenia purpurea var. burkii]